jgi:hypothetical protein
MQTTKQPTGLRTAASNDVTLVQQAINIVTGFDQLYKELDRAINVTVKTRSIFTNYSRHLAHLALHYNQLPTELDQEQVLDYLHLIKPESSSSATFFKFTLPSYPKPHTTTNKLPKVPYNRCFIICPAGTPKPYLLAAGFGT